MRWSLKLGRWLGIDVYLHFSFLLFIVLSGVLQVMDGGSWAAGFEGVLFLVAVFGCILLHEFGHALAARGFGIGTRDITLLPIGGVARLDRLPDRPIQELLVALAGPAVNIVIAVLLCGWLLLGTGGFALQGENLTELPFALRLLLVNVALVVFNMIPAFPMDGGRVLRAGLATVMDYVKATNVAATLGKGIAVIFALLGLGALWSGMGNPMLLFIAWFVWMGAKQEAAFARLRFQLEREALGRAI